MNLNLAAALTAVAALSGPSTATADITGDPQLVNATREMSVPAPKYAVLHRETCPAFSGDCAYPDGRVYIKTYDPGLESPLSLRMRLFHELGHRFAQERPWVLRAFRKVMHGRGGDERFAAAYDNCARDQESPGPAESRYVEAWNENDGYHPYRQTHRRVCALIRSAEPQPLDVVLAMRGPDVTVITDGIWRHWRSWPVKSTQHLARNERCQARIDARRVLRGKRPTQGLPARCMSRWEQRRGPDQHPSAGH